MFDAPLSAPPVEVGGLNVLVGLCSGFGVSRLTSIKRELLHRSLGVRSWVWKVRPSYVQTEGLAIERSSNHSRTSAADDAVAAAAAAAAAAASDDAIAAAGSGR